jgi:hypothetical protein
MLLLLKLLFAASLFATGCGDFFTWFGIVEKREAQINRAVLNEIEGDLFDWQKRAVFPQHWNEDVLNALEALPVTGPERGRLGGADDALLRKLQLDHVTNPVSGSWTVQKYDPCGKIGFCFGRAMNSHLKALRMGLAKENVRKIWAIGPMKYGYRDEEIWTHHVATMVRGEDKKWYVIDKKGEMPMELREWYAQAKRFSTDGRLQLFATDPARWGPASNDVYSREELADDFYNGYFDDLLKASREEAQDLIRQRKKLQPRP